MLGFKKCPYPTVGVEEEYGLVDPDSADLVPALDAVMGALDARDAPNYCPELMQCFIEGHAGPARRVGELFDRLMAVRTRLARAARQVGVAVSASGGHPYDDLARLPVVDDDHYAWVVARHALAARRLMALGLHVHVAVRTEAVLLGATAALRRWVAPLVAMSANSPFSMGVDTGFDSYRQVAIGALPRTGFPPAFETLEEVRDYIDRMTATGDIARPGDLWWSVRPNVPLGTVEVRACDLPTEPWRVAALVGVIRGLVVYWQNGIERGERPPAMAEEYLEQNLWSARRFGLEGRIVDPATRETLPMREQARRMIARAAEGNDTLDDPWPTAAEAERLLAKGNEASWQRRRLKDLDGDLRALELEVVGRSMGS